MLLHDTPAIRFSLMISFAAADYATYVAMLPYAIRYDERHTCRFIATLLIFIPAARLFSYAAMMLMPAMLIRYFTTLIFRCRLRFSPLYERAICPCYAIFRRHYAMLLDIFDKRCFIMLLIFLSLLMLLLLPRVLLLQVATCCFDLFCCCYGHFRRCHMLFALFCHDMLILYSFDAPPLQR